MAWSSLFSLVEEGVGLFALLVGLGLDDLAPSKAQALAPLGHRPGGGQELLPIPLRSARRQGGFGSPARGGQAGATRRSLLRMGLGELPPRFSDLRMPRCPAFAATAGRLRTETPEASASRGPAKRHRLAAPTTDGFRPQRMAVTILQRHLGLKGAPCGTGQVGCREAQSGHVCWTGQRQAVQHGMGHGHDRASRRELGFAFLEDHLSMPTLTEYELFRKSPKHPEKCLLQP